MGASKLTGALNHTQKVRLLYKSCLKLHRGLPLHLKAIGDTYVKDEFRRHKKADSAQTQIFMEAWAKYAIQLTNQLGKRGVHTAQTIGGDYYFEDERHHNMFLQVKICL